VTVVAVTSYYAPAPRQFCSSIQWRRSIVKYGGQGQSGQTISLFQITSYTNDFQSLNNPVPDAVGA